MKEALEKEPNIDIKQAMAERLVVEDNHVVGMKDQTGFGYQALTVILATGTIFDALEWLAAMCSHVPNKGKQMVRYYGYYSNVSRGKRKKQDQDKWIPCILEPDESSPESRKNWAKLIQEIYEVDPLTCPKCSGKMKVISVIEDEEVIKKILKHIGLWDVKARPLPRAIVAAKNPEDHIDYSTSQVPVSDNYLYVDPVYSDGHPV